MELQTSLTTLRTRIRENYDRVGRFEKSMVETKLAWATAWVGIGVDMVAARREMKDHAEFGSWLKDAGIDMNHQDRAALLRMSNHPKELLDVLVKTTRKALQHIY